MVIFVKVEWNDKDGNLIVMIPLEIERQGNKTASINNVFRKFSIKGKMWDHGYNETWHLGMTF